MRRNSILGPRLLEGLRWIASGAPGAVVTTQSPIPDVRVVRQQRGWTYRNFFASLANDRADDLLDDHAEVLRARGLMAVLYREAALLVVEASRGGVNVSLRDWTTADRFEIKVGIQDVWVEREGAQISLLFRNFPAIVVPHSTVALTLVNGETPQEFAGRVMVGVKRAFWPDAKG